MRLSSRSSSPNSCPINITKSHVSNITQKAISVSVDLSLDSIDSLLTTCLQGIGVFAKSFFLFSALHGQCYVVQSGTILAFLIFFLCLFLAIDALVDMSSDTLKGDVAFIAIIKEKYKIHFKILDKVQKFHHDLVSILLSLVVKLLAQ